MPDCFKPFINIVFTITFGITSLKEVNCSLMPLLFARLGLRGMHNTVLDGGANRGCVPSHDVKIIRHDEVVGTTFWQIRSKRWPFGLAHRPTDIDAVMPCLLRLEGVSTTEYLGC